jgi:large subunit ribosomal protein L23|tara:strand:- start:238 stop:561 length:324 start_codon:yes stop_codon:yes gene_type:complete
MSARREKPVSVSTIEAYDIILAPLVTEKSTMGSENNQITFTVPLSATKPQIKAAIEELFKVKVNAVNTLRQKGKVKRFRGKLGKRPDYKKAIVSLADGEMIDVSTGI